MEEVLPAESKRMMLLLLEGGPEVKEAFHVSGTAQSRHELHTRLRHLRTGHVIDRVFTDNERVPVVQLETRRITYSNTKGGTHVFLDAATIGELDISDEQLRERRWFLKENEKSKVLLLEGRLFDIVLPAQVPLRVRGHRSAHSGRFASDLEGGKAGNRTRHQVVLIHRQR